MYIVNNMATSIYQTKYLHHVRKVIANCHCLLKLLCNEKLSLEEHLLGETNFQNLIFSKLIDHPIVADEVEF
jgi:hypothetical protein